MTEVILPYSGQETYELNVEGFKRTLPLIQVSEDTWIAYFDSLGDRGFISFCAKKLAERLKECEVLITSETKGIPLAHEVSNILQHPYYVVCRKGVKPFMKEPLITEYKPITSDKTITLAIDGRQVIRLRGKKVGIVDDIVSTRETLDAIERLVKLAGGSVVKKAAILVEGQTHEDVDYLGVLPIFKRS